MAPEILGVSPPIDQKLVKEVVIETVASLDTSNTTPIRSNLAPLFQENILAKLLGAAEAYLENNFPETVPQSGPNQGIYKCRDAEFWTCGFFPGSLYCLLERLRKHPKLCLLGISSDSLVPQNFHERLLSHLTDLCHKWSAPLHPMSARKDTHDLGFIIQPALRRDWELFGQQESLKSLLSAAESLASRYDQRVGAIRSWDSFANAHHNITSTEDDFIVIIDSLCNLDLLFYAGNYTRSSRLVSIASTHATTLLSTHLRKEIVPNKGTYYSTYHAANFSPAKNGAVKRKLTAQGYSDSSTWARGQAWAILGYAQTYSWTKKRKFLDAAMGLADYFTYRVESSAKVVEAGGYGQYVPLWDFDAPITYTTVNGAQVPLRDVSAGMIAANGMVVLYGQLMGIGEYESAGRYLDHAMAIAKDTVALAYNRDEMRLKFDEESGKIRVGPSGGANGRRFDAILERSTANFNENHPDRDWDHGLVYADYYFLELGNRLLDMGLV
ncbi:Six-hairpin glycosidase-like protein [Penicillium cataractarum]|uniref:Six-hairpin glycosidase-like protein n=1 Tax=Penicillium cataractarum TaxID=2100454 RepID=A0A9W9SHM7_9EURO|nr:Six-hairpin glycosidase-like protein [Penicillium cataractarum]KAJ5377849.1 Six-hairpin glycosidase-like protein [Penicillium cataractarum]